MHQIVLELISVGCNFYYKIVGWLMRGQWRVLLLEIVKVLVRVIHLEKGIERVMTLVGRI